MRVYIAGDATTTGAASCEIVLGEEGAEMDSAGNIDGSALLLPGKTYQLAINAYNIANATINLRPAGNYEVIVDGSPKRQIQVFNSFTGQVLTETFDVEIRAATGGVPGGDTGIAIGNETVWGVGLGRLYNGAPAGNLVIRSAALDDSVFDRRLLSYSGMNRQVNVIMDTGGKIAQILTPETFATVTDNDETGGFDIAFYPLASVGLRNPGGLYDLNSGIAPYVTYYIAPSLGSANDFGFVVTKQAGSHVLATTAAYDAGTWMKDMGGQISIEQRDPDGTFNGAPSQRAEIIIIKDGNGVIAKKTKRIYQTFQWNKSSTQPEELIQEIQDPDGDAWTTTYEYHTVSSNKGSYGRIKSIVYPDGNWVKYDYYTDLVLYGRNSRTGMVSREYYPWLDTPSSPADAASGSGRVVDYDYTTDWDGQKTIVSSRIEAINGVIVGKMTATADINQTFNSLKAWTYTQTLYASATAPLATVTKAYQTNQTDADALFNGLLISIENPDGTKVSYAHQRGTYDNGIFTVTPDGDAMREIEVSGIVNPTGLASIHGAPLDPVGVIANRSTAITRIRDKGRIMREGTSVYNGATFEEIAWTTFAYDAAGRLVSRVNSNDTAYTATYDGDFRTSETTETGIHQTYLPDALLRVASATKIGAPANGNYAAQSDLHTEYAYDAAGRIISQQRHDGSSSIMQETTTYDLSGRAATRTNVNGLTSASSETLTSAGTLRRIVNPACGGTVITDYHRDGQPDAVSGNATIGQRFAYAIDPATGFIITTINNGPESVTGSYTIEIRDWLGRAVSVTVPGPNQNTLTTAYHYNTLGQLFKVTRPGLAPMIYEYDSMGAIIRSGAAVSNANATTLSPASNDRFTEQTSAFAKIGGSWWLESITKAPLSAGSGAFTTRIRLNGFTAGKVVESQTTDANGNLATSFVQVDSMNRLHYEVTRTPVSTIDAERVYYNGLLVEEIGPGGETMRYAYDSLGRPALTIPQKTAIVRTYYNTYSAGGRTFTTAQAWQTQFEAADGTPGTLIARYAYDNAGRVVCVTDTCEATTRSAYNCLGQLTHRWGSAAQPVSYTYDNLGRLTAQTTHRATTSDWDTDTWPAGVDGDTTTFDYYGDLPLALSRTDDAGKTISWEYDNCGRPIRTTNARGQAIDYTYAPATGELATKTMPLPGAMPAATGTTTFAYNRAGQLAAVTDALGTRTYTYGGASGGDLLSETLPAYYDAALGSATTFRQLAYSYETATSGIAGRLNRVALGLATAPNTPELACTYAYTAVGRIAKITAAPAGQPARSFVYDYAADAPWLMTGMSHDTNPETLRRAITYNEKFGSIESIDTTWKHGTASPASQARYDYTYDNRAQRLTAKQSGGFYADYGSPTYYQYDYNSRGELLSARQYLGDDATAQTNPLPGRQYGYTYDSMGNRLATRRTSTPDSDLDEHYQINSLNQIVTKENKATPLSGTMLEGAKAYAAGPGVASPGLTKGRFWNIETLLPNATAPAKADLTIYFGKAGAAPGGADAFSTQQRTAFQRQQNESCLHDNDGNLASDGLWEYTYDAENRLIAMETLPGVRSLLATPGAPQPRRLEFTYDYLGRRVGKKTYNWQNDIWVTDKHLKFIYDGWNLIAEYETGTSTSTPNLNLKRSFVWGLDCAGSQTATAGVGALLMIQSGSNAYFPAFDGNGNVAGLLDQNGSAAAKYEYNPYGELTRVEGPHARENPFRWSTKYTDTETGLVYYGLRYYSPRTGRFLNRDPIGEHGGLNLYGFVNNNPAGLIDILGLERICMTIRSFKQKMVTNSNNTGVTVIGWHETSEYCYNNTISVNFGSVGGGSGSGVNGPIDTSLLEDTIRELDKQKLCHDLRNQLDKLIAQYNEFEKTAAQLEGRDPNTLNSSSVGSGFLIAGSGALGLADLANMLPTQVITASVDNYDYTKISSSSRNVTIAGRVGIGLTGAGVVLDAYNAYDSFSDGDYARGLQYSITTGIGVAVLRGAVVRGGASSAIGSPIVGAVVGGISLVGDVGGTMYANSIIREAYGALLNTTNRAKQSHRNAIQRINSEMQKNGCD